MRGLRAGGRPPPWPPNSGLAVPVPAPSHPPRRIDRLILPTGYSSGCWLSLLTMAGTGEAATITTGRHAPGGESTTLHSRRGLGTGQLGDLELGRVPLVTSREVVYEMTTSRSLSI